jgi:hypothetical protein
MIFMTRHDEPLKDLDELFRRILGGEDPAAINADFDRRRAARRAEFDRQIAELQAKIDECQRIMASCAPIDKVH